MILDQFTTSFLTALVVIVSAVLYITETLMRKDGAAGRLWVVAFLSGVLTVVCYLVWALEPSAFVAVAFGNGAFVASAAFVWLGALAFNGRRLHVPGISAAVGITAAVVVVLVSGPDGGDWAGAVPMFILIAGFAALGTVETRRGDLGRRWSALGLTATLALESVFFIARTIVFVMEGPDSDFFVTWFGSHVASLLTITLTIVAVVVMSVLRAGESNLRGQRDTYSLHIALDGIMMPASFRSAVSTTLQRARRSQETLCLVAVSVDDLPRLATAFGPGDAEAVAAAWRTGVRRYAPTAALVGEYSSTVLLAAFLTASGDVRRTVRILHRRIIDDLAGLGLSVVPVVGVGIALTDEFGYDFEQLSDAARDAASRSSSSPDASVISATA